MDFFAFFSQVGRGWKNSLTVIRISPRVSFVFSCRTLQGDKRAPSRWYVRKSTFSDIDMVSVTLLIKLFPFSLTDRFTFENIFSLWITLHHLTDWHFLGSFVLRSFALSDLFIKLSAIWKSRGEKNGVNWQRLTSRSSPVPFLLFHWPWFPFFSLWLRRERTKQCEKTKIIRWDVQLSR